MSTPLFSSVGPRPHPVNAKAADIYKKAADDMKALAPEDRVLILMPGSRRMEMGNEPFDLMFETPALGVLDAFGRVIHV